MLLMWTENVDCGIRWTMVEFFSGEGAVSNIFRNDPNHRVASFELRDSHSMDINSSAGLAFFICNSAYVKLGVCLKHVPRMILSISTLRLAILLVLQSSPGALHLMAPVCGSWTRISRGTSWRSCMNCFGDLSKEWITGANQMISR